jgi:hypothetical protein
MDAQPSEAILAAVKELEADRATLLQMTKAMWEAYDGAMYPLDLYANGAINRALSLSMGFESLILQRNILCVGALLRLELDTAIRFAAAWRVDEPHTFALKVLKGTPVRRLKDQTGQLMSDAYLVKCLSPDYPWLEKVYETTSGYIHLSDTHISSSVASLDAKTMRFEFQVSSRDDKQPDSLYLEAVAAFREATQIFMRYLRGWTFTKCNPDVVAKMKQAQLDEVCSANLPGKSASGSKIPTDSRPADAAESAR